MSVSNPSLQLAVFFSRAEKLLDRLEQILPPAPAPTDWNEAIAYRWIRTGISGHFAAIKKPHRIELEALHHIDPQKERIIANTEQFLAGHGANNVLLTGARGSGKSSLIKALLTKYANQGLRMIEVDKYLLADLPSIVQQLEERKEFFIIFCDDLSFDHGDPSYKALKVALDGSLAAPPDNILIYATSNRRHLMPEFFSDNQDHHSNNGEIHPGESIEEKISLSDRFGLWLSFYPFDQDDYLNIVRYWLSTLGQLTEDEWTPSLERDALNWALSRGSRSGRTAHQFALDWVGCHRS